MQIVRIHYVTDGRIVLRPKYATLLRNDKPGRYMRCLSCSLSGPMVGLVLYNIAGSLHALSFICERSNSRERCLLKKHVDIKGYHFFSQCKAIFIILAVFVIAKVRNAFVFLPFFFASFRCLSLFPSLIYISSCFSHVQILQWCIYRTNFLFPNKQRESHVHVGLRKSLYNSGKLNSMRRFR